MTDATVDTLLQEMRSAVIQAAGNRVHGETIERWLERSARRLGITYARAFNYWHRRLKRVDAHEADNIRQRLRAYAVDRIVELRAEIAILEGTPVAQATSAPVGLDPTAILDRRHEGERRSGKDRRQA